MVKNLPANAVDVALEKEMATHPVLAWQTKKRTEKPGRLYSPWGHKRVRHDLATKQYTL